MQSLGPLPEGEGGVSCPGWERTELQKTRTCSMPPLRQGSREFLGAKHGWYLTGSGEGIYMKTEGGACFQPGEAWSGEAGRVGQREMGQQLGRPCCWR